MTNKKHEIDAVINDTLNSYAYAWLEKSHGYGHMNMVIMFAGKSDWRRPEGCIKVSCQIGGSEENQCNKVYAERMGFDPRFGHGALEEVEIAAKLLRKITKSLDAMYENFGNPKDYAEYCQRVLVASGAKKLIVEPDYYGGGGAMRDKRMVRVGPTSAEELAVMHAELVAGFTGRMQKGW